MNIADQEKWLVMPSEIGALESCTGFVKLAGGYPAARVDYRTWLPKSKGAASYVDRFAPVQESPPRDPRFNLARRFEAGSVDPLIKFKEDFDAGKGATTPTEKPKEGPTEYPGPQDPNAWDQTGHEEREIEVPEEVEHLEGDDRARTLATFASVQVQQNDIANLLMAQANQDQVQDLQKAQQQDRGGVMR